MFHGWIKNEAKIRLCYDYSTMTSLPTKIIGHWRRKLAVSPAERRFKNVMGFWYYYYNMKHLYLPHGIRGYEIDFAVRRWGKKVAIEIDSERWHTNVIGDAVREEHLMADGWSVLRIKVAELKNPRWVRKETRRFIKKSPRNPTVRKVLT